MSEDMQALEEALKRAKRGHSDDCDFYMSWGEPEECDCGWIKSFERIRDLFKQQQRVSEEFICKCVKNRVAKGYIPIAEVREMLMKSSAVGRADTRYYKEEPKVSKVYDGPNADAILKEHGYEVGDDD